MGGLLPVAGPKNNGLQNLKYAPVVVSTSNNYKYIRLHKTASTTWVSIGFKFYMMAGGSNEFYCIVCGNTANGNDGVVKVTIIGKTTDIAGTFKILWKQNSDYSIEIYLAAIGNMGNRVAIKENLNGLNDNMELIQSLDESGCNTISIS